MVITLKEWMNFKFWAGKIPNWQMKMLYHSFLYYCNYCTSKGLLVLAPITYKHEIMMLRYVGHFSVEIRLTVVYRQDWCQTANFVFFPRFFFNVFISEIHGGTKEIEGKSGQEVCQKWWKVWISTKNLREKLKRNSKL